MRRFLASALLLASAAAAPARADPPQPPLPAPFATRSVSNFSEKVPWPDGRTPKADGPFEVTLFADGLDHPRWLLELPNGDVLASEARSNEPGVGRVMLLRDQDGDGLAETKEVFLTNEAGTLNQPFGMALLGRDLYVAATDGVWRYPYRRGATSVDPRSGEKVLDLPADGYNNHYTRNVFPSRDRRRLYVTVGSSTNVDEERLDEKDPRRAAVLEFDIATRKSRVFASGLRNPNGLDWNPVTGKLWAAVNERDRLGDDLVPDFVTSLKRGGFYGWPYYYFGDYPDPRKAGERPDLAKKSLVPDLAVGAHTATLGLAFYTGSAFPERYRNGLFIAQHGSWNRSRAAGYRVAFVPFDPNGNVAGPAQPFLTGFLSDRNDLTANGRPVCVIMAREGSLLVSDDVGDRVWRVRQKGRDDGRPSLGGLMLVDAERDRPIYPLVDGATLDPAKLRTSRLDVVASPDGPVGSVRFEIDGKEDRVANEPPFTI
ncbi:PQQ-dependent sugar dehydrogenase, partial [Hansschlegelia zhihuaiae]